MENLTPDEMRQVVQDYQACPSGDKAARRLREHRALRVYNDLAERRIPAGERYVAAHPDDLSAAAFLAELREIRTALWQILWRDYPGRTYPAQERQHDGRADRNAQGDAQRGRDAGAGEARGE